MYGRVMRRVMRRVMEMSEYRVMKGRKETPCCGQLIRVKIVEPGVQLRKCELCREISHFTLEPTMLDPNVLRLRWLSDAEVEEMSAGTGSGIGVEDL